MVLHKLADRQYSKPENYLLLVENRRSVGLRNYVVDYLLSKHFPQPNTDFWLPKFE